MGTNANKIEYISNNKARNKIKIKTQDDYFSIIFFNGISSPQKSFFFDFRACKMR